MNSLTGDLNKKQSLTGKLSNGRGLDGKDGNDGKSAYEYAVEGGYTGTEEEFAKELVNKADRIVVTSEGSPIVQTDTSESGFEGLRVFGKSEQVQGVILGNNLCSVESIANELIKLDTVIPAGTYFFSCVGGNSILSFRNSTGLIGVGGSIALSQGVENKTTMTLTEDAYYLYKMGDVTATNIMVSVEDLPYEPYTKITTPNPSNQSPITSAGDSGSIEVGVYGKNRIDLSKGIGETLTEYDGIWTLTRTSASVGTVLIPVDIPANTSFTISTILLDHTVSENCLKFYFTDDKGKQLYAGLYTNLLQRTYTHDARIVGMRFYVESNESVGAYWRFKEFQIELGSSASEYEAPKTKQSLIIPTPNGLPAIEVTDPTLATYMDADGVMWCADEIDYKNRKYVQRIGKKVFDGSDDEVWYTWGSGFAVYILDAKIYSGAEVANALCSHAIVCEYDRAYAETKGFGGGSLNGKSLWVFNFGLNTQDEWIAFLQENPITVQYILAEPIETDLTAEEIEAYNELHANYPTTTIMNDAGCHMEVGYVADTKNYIDGKFKELQVALANTNAQLL